LVVAIVAVMTAGVVFLAVAISFSRHGFEVECPKVHAKSVGKFTKTYM
jgi:biopolymer transport protein ExbD